MKMAPCPATGGSWQVLEVLGDGGSGEDPSFKQGLPPIMHFHRNRYYSPGVSGMESRDRAMTSRGLLVPSD